MEKIDLFFILGSEAQTFRYEKKVHEMEREFARGRMQHHTTLEDHYFMLSRHFNLRNFYRYHDRIETFQHPVIYHLPYGKDHETGVEEHLLRYKGRVPIVMRSYDPHSPLKTSTEYMEKYHDLTITYLRERVNGKNIRFGNLCYDNHLFGTRSQRKIPNNVVCAIARNRKGEQYERKPHEFSEKGLTLEKAYRLRDEFVNLPGLDVYGQGWPATMRNYAGMLYPFDQKYALLEQYRFTLILENAITDNMISEKILDAFLTDTVPIYLGSPTVDEHLPSETFIDLRKFDTLHEAISAVYGASTDQYIAMKDRIQHVRERIFVEFTTEHSFSREVYRRYRQISGTTLGPTKKEYVAFENNLRSLRIRSSNKAKAQFIRRAALIKDRLSHLFR
jgi:hypothetical protein